MSQKYADIIIDISHEGVDRTFEYKIPDELVQRVQVGSVVKVPFGQGNRTRQGYVISVKDSSEWDSDKLKEILQIDEKAVEVEGNLIRLAGWMRETYGGTMIASLRTVMPVKEKVAGRKQRIDVMDEVPEFAPVGELTAEQAEVVNTFEKDYDAGLRDRYLLHGITGSGKTEVYIRLAEKVIKSGSSVIVLVPEIAITYQTVARFRTVFGNRISILNSRLSKGEKYREFERARSGETDIIIGPRSALFAPFEKLGLIIIDEEHDGSYKSETTPKYHAREVSFERARIEGAAVVLGSATPSVVSYYMAERGDIRRLTLKRRASGGSLAEVSVVDMRDELHRGNRSIISGELHRRLSDAFSAGEQAMLFINRRGFNSFVSCRECGEVIRCPRCDVSLSLHGNAKLMCHYCGHTEAMPSACPKCKSKLIGGYGTGTEKVEAEIKKLFPGIRTLRMDKDTTQRKDSHGKIIEAFRRHDADCLIGTQMIVKGHDFGNVTVVGAVLADLGLFDSDYESAERTFDLLTQAAGRAGRAEKKGYVVIQTYQPEHYSVITAAKQDFEGFYQYEMAYRRMLRFPPVYELLGVLITSKDEEKCTLLADRLTDELKQHFEGKGTDIIGPAEAVIYRIDEVYRKTVYIKADDACKLTGIIDFIQKRTVNIEDAEVQTDLNPLRIV
ncbi:MAG: primosomal protein N' [Eubacterium sp.]|nr:primosomal protein N' [Eubacterium sp.]